MDNKAVLGFLVLAAAAALFFLFGGTDLLRGGAGGGTDAGPSDGLGGEGLGADGADAEDGPGADEAPSRGPVLFGRARAERAGLGGLTGRVMEFDTGKALAGAVVVVSGAGFADEAVALRTLTDAHGHFLFEEMAAGDDFSLHVTDAAARERTVPSVAVAAGERRDVGTIWMGKASALTGSVLDERGLPLGGADVQVHPGSGSMLELIRNLTKMIEVMDQDAKPVARAVSDRTGRFEVSELAPGPYTLVVRAAGHRLATRTIVMTSSGPAGGALSVRMFAAAPIVGFVVDERGRGIAGARVAVLEKNEMVSVLFGRQFSYTDADGRFEIASPPTQGAFAVIVGAEGYPTLFTEAQPGREELRFVLRRGTEVVVRILESETERPIEGAHLMAMFAKTLQAAGSRASFASGTTDDRGEASFLAAPGKLQMLFLNHPERGAGMFNPMLATMGRGTGTLQGPEDTTIGEARTTFVFHLKRGVTVRGVVTDPDGAPLAGARVSVMGMMGAGGATMSGADGRYELPDQSPPLTVVLADLRGYVQAPASLRSGGGLLVPDEGGEIVRDIRMDVASSISGRVVDERGKPLAGVQVRASGDGALMVLSQFTGQGGGITNAAGRYVLDDISRSERVHVLGRSAGYLDGKTAAFAVGEGAVQAPDLVLRRGATVRVRVERPDGRALGGARVQVSVAAEAPVRWDVFSDFRGFADVLTTPAGTADVRDLPPGSITFTATHKGFAGARRSIALARDGPPPGEVVLRLREAFALEGRVVDEDGRPIAEAAVQCQAPPGANAEGDEAYVPTVLDTTDARGRFRLEGLPDVELALLVTAEGRKPASQTLRPPQRGLEVRLPKVDADSARRIEAIDAELGKIYGAFAQAKDADERKALTQRMLALQKEKAALAGGDGAAGAEPDEPVRDEDR